MKSKKNNSAPGSHSEMSSTLSAVANNKTPKKNSKPDGQNLSALIPDEWDASHTKSPDKNVNPVINKKKDTSAKAQVAFLNQQLAIINEQLIAATQYAEGIINTIKEPLLVLDKNLRVRSANHAFNTTFNVNQQNIEGVLIYHLGNNHWNIPELQTLLEETLSQKIMFAGFEFTDKFTDIGERVMLLNARLITREKTAEKLILLTFEDITEKASARKKNKARKKVEESEAKYRSLFDTMDQGFCIVEVLFDQNNNPVDYLFVEVNPVFEEQSGLKNAAGKTMLQLVPDLERYWMDIYGKVVTTGESIRFIEGSEVMGRMFDIYAFKMGEVGSRRVAILFTDITERKIAEKNLIESEERFRSLVMATSDTIYKMSADWKVMYNLEGKDFLADTTDGSISWLIKYIPEAARTLVIKTIEEAIAHKKIFELEHQVFDADGNIAWTYSRAVPKLNREGEIIEWIGAASNITERKRAEQTLVESEAKYRSLIANAPVAIGILKGRELIIESPNQTFLRFIGKDESIIGKPLAKAMPELKGQPFLQILDDVFTSGKMFHSSETPGKAVKDGVLTDGYYDITYQPLLDKNGEVYAILNIMMDTTVQVTASKKIAESEAFNRAVLESSPDCIKMLDADGRLQFMNSNGICLLEIDDFKMVQNTHWWDMWEPHNRQTIKDAVATAKNGEKIQLQISSPTAKGTPKWWDIIVLPVHLDDGIDKNLNRILSVSRDITSQKLNELKEKELLTRFQNLVIQAPVAICVLRGIDYVIETINEEMLQMWARKMEDALNKPAFDVLPEFRDQGLKELLDTVYNSGERIVIQELPLTIRRHKRMENIFVQFVYEPLREADGTITGVMALAHEITEQVLARKKTEESEAHFRRLADLMPAKISNADALGYHTYFNHQWLEFSGYSFEELRNFGYQKMIHPDDIDEFKKRFKKAAETQTVLEMEMRFLNKKGEYIWHLKLSSPVLDDNGEIKMWVGVTTEIQKIKEEEERRGDFIKMVSHELKTPVTSIKGYVQLLLMMVEEEENCVFPAPVKSSLIRIDKQIVKLTRLISEMLDLSRIEADSLEMQKEFFSINDLAAEAVDDIANTNTTHTILLKQEFACKVFGDRDRIGQVMINFITNAIKYSPNNNTVEVTVQQGENNEVAVSVKDAGIGIGKEEHEKIFERFYRVGGKSEQTFPGFGIGLFISHAIIQKHNGRIQIESELGKGSSFTFTLLVAQQNNPQNG